MKISLLLIAAVFACQTYAVSNDDYKTIGLLQAYLLENLGRTFRCPESQRELVNNETEKAVQCVKNIRSNSSFCDTFILHFKPCVDTLLQTTKDCHSPKDREVEKSMLNSIIAEAKFICNTDGEHILEMFNPCVRRSLALTRPCIRNLTVYEREHPFNDTGMSETDIEASMCTENKRFVDGAKECFNDKFNAECINPITKDALQGLLDVEVEPCNLLTPLFFNLYSFFF